MQGLIILFISFLTIFILSKTTNIQPLTNMNNQFEYIPIITSNIFADLIIIYLSFTYLLGSKNSKSWIILENWYKKYRLSAMIADILIGVLYLIIARYIAFVSKIKFDLFTFSILAVCVQLVFDFLFYVLFTLIPKGENNMLDLFKEWAKYAKLDALWGDSILVIIGVIISALLNNLSFDQNIFILILSIYLIPYFIYMKD
jgi:hypothetical protein